MHGSGVATMHQVSKTGFRVLDTLSRNLGTALPISVLTQAIEKRFGTGHYKNVHQAVSQLQEAGYLRVEKTGRTSLVSLDLTRMETVDLLAEIDLRSRRGNRTGPLTMPTSPARIAEVLIEQPAVGTAFLVDAEINETLNRLELVAAVRPPPGAESGDTYSGGDGVPPLCFTDLHERLQDEARKANVRLDALLLTEAELKQGLASTALHPVQAQAKRRTALVDPQCFWWLIRAARREGPEPRMREIGSPRDSPLDLVSPLRSDPDRLGQHLQRFGYAEMGASDDLVQEVSLELVVTAALGSQEPRRRYASAVLLAKNDSNPRLLAFLAKKHGLAEELLGMTEALGEHPRSPKLAEIRSFLPEDVEPASVDRDRVEELLDLYGAIS